MGYSDALASIAAVSSAAAFYVLQMVTTQYSARLARRVARGWVGLGPLILIGLFVATVIWSQPMVGRILVLAGLAAVALHLWWVATSALSDENLLHASVPTNAVDEVLHLDLVTHQSLPIAPEEFREMAPVIELETTPKAWVVEPRSWPGGSTSYADPLLMLADLLIGAIRQYNTALIDRAFETLLTRLREVIDSNGRVDEYLASMFDRVIQASSDEGFIHNRINTWLAHAVVLVLPGEYPQNLLLLMKQQWAHLWVRKEMDHLSDNWSLMIHGMTASTNTTWNLLDEWIRWARDWISTHPWPEAHDELSSMWYRVFDQLCNLGLASSDAVGDVCQMAPYVIGEVVPIPSMNTLPASLIIALVDTIVNSYRLNQLRTDHCADVINGLTETRLKNTVAGEGLADRLPGVLIDHAFQIFAVQANLPIDAYCLGHSAGDIAGWLSIWGTDDGRLISRGIAAMHTPLWGLSWGVFKRGIQAWVWYLARGERIRLAVGPYGTWRVGRRKTHEPQFIKALRHTSDEYDGRRTQELNDMMDSLKVVHQR